eukprot:GFUD01025258.1.p1 GENE.GFUD01025258.1~~GFUD01025258.1.p1  ORF type:complete len:430 (+),score=137.91 GFUD01025258.1:171-1460(+)
MSSPSLSPVYLDYNATTPLAPEVITAISSSLATQWGNPSSGYQSGKVAAEAVKEGRRKVAEMIGASSEEITFTSGGTESNHLAIWSALASYRDCLTKHVVTSRPPCPPSGPTCHPVTSNIPHIVTSNIEHCAVTLPLQTLEKEGLCTVTYVPVVPGAGRWTVQSVLNAVTQDTCLVTLMLANNETGILQPVKELFTALKQDPPKTRSPLMLHTDAAQAIGKLRVNAQELRADLLTIVGHKFYGPRIGALYHRADPSVRVTPMFYGGGQESGVRPGSENTPMIVGLGVACQLVSDNLARYEGQMRTVRDHLRDQLIRNFELVTSDEPVSLQAGQICWRYVDRFMLPNTLSVRFGGCRGAELLALCREDVEASTGAACHTGGGVSTTLVNSFLWGEAGAAETVRLSVGRDTSKEDVERVVRAIKKAVEQKK